MLHTIPLIDTGDRFFTEAGHTFDTTCPCGAVVECNNEIMVVHNAYDTSLGWGIFRGDGRPEEIALFPEDKTKPVRFEPLIHGEAEDG